MRNQMEQRAGSGGGAWEQVRPGSKQLAAAASPSLLPNHPYQPGRPAAQPCTGLCASPACPAHLSP